MRIGIDIRTLLDPRPTGVGVYLESVAQQMLEMDTISSFCCFANSARPTQARPLPQFLRQHLGQVTLHEYQYSNRLLNARMRFFGRPLLDQLVGGVDVFFLPNPTLYALGATVPLVVTVHDLSFVRYPQFFSPKMLLWQRLVAGQKLVARAVRVIADSEATRRDLIELWRVPADKVVVIPLGVDRQVFRPDISVDELDRVRQQYHLPARFILSFGALEPRKNIIGLIEAFERVADPEIHLVVAGPRGWLYQPVLSRIRRSTRAHQIHVLDYVAPEDQPALYVLARVFAYPSFFEGFGLPPLEAMSSGTPVVSSFTSSLSEVVGSAGLLVDPYSVSDLSEALEQVISDGHLRAELSRAGIDRAKNFSWEQTAQKTLAVLTSVAG